MPGQLSSGAFAGELGRAQAQEFGGIAERLGMAQAGMFGNMMGAAMPLAYGARQNQVGNVLGASGLGIQGAGVGMQGAGIMNQADIANQGNWMQGQMANQNAWLQNQGQQIGGMGAGLNNINQMGQPQYAYNPSFGDQLWGLLGGFTSALGAGIGGGLTGGPGSIVPAIASNNPSQSGYNTPTPASYTSYTPSWMQQTPIQQSMVGNFGMTSPWY